MNNTKKQMLLNQIMKYQFAVLDAALFLDTHPNDTTALAYHNKYSTMLRQLKYEYERYYGPLSFYKPQQNYWKYIKGPWPWEINY